MIVPASHAYCRALKRRLAVLASDARALAITRRSFLPVIRRLAQPNGPLG